MFQADRTNDMVTQHTEGNNFVLFFFNFGSLTFTFCLDWFVLLLLSYPVGVESACKDCNKVCLSPSQWWLYERKCLRDSASLCYHLLPFPTNTALAVAIMVCLLTWWVTVKVNFYTFIQRHSVFTPVLLPLLCCKIHACDLFNLNRDIEVISLSGKKNLV